MTKEKLKHFQEHSKCREYFFLTFCVPASFLFGLLGLTKKGHGYWTTTIILLAVFAFVTLVILIKDYFLYYRDKIKQQKYKGVITIIGKSPRKGDKIIFTNAPELKKLNLYTDKLFDEVSIGDKLTIEISRFSKTLFKLDKDQVDLLNYQ
jgi:hypothetical protein